MPSPYRRPCYSRRHPRSHLVLHVRRSRSVRMGGLDMTAVLGRLIVITLVACSCAALGPAALAQGLSDMRGTVVDSSGGALPGVSDRHHQSGQRHLPRGDQQRRRQLVRARADAGRLPGVGGAHRLQTVPAPRPAGDRRHDHHRAGVPRTGRARGDRHGDQRSAAHRRDLQADRRQPRHEGPDAAAEHLAQLARLRRAAAGRHPGAEPGVVGLGDDLGQRRRLAATTRSWSTAPGTTTTTWARTTAARSGCRSRACRNRKS